MQHARSIERVRSLLLSFGAAAIGFAAAQLAAAGRHRTPADAPRVLATASPARPLPAPNAPTPAPIDKPPRERLALALRRQSPLESAAQAFPAIAAMTAADFSALLEKPREFHVPWVYGFDREYSDAFMDALIERWFTVDPGGALGAIRGVETKLINSPGSVSAGAGDFLGAVARVRPELLLDSLGEKLAWDRSDHSVPIAFTKLGGRDAKAAAAYLERVSDPEQRKAAQSLIAQGHATKDPIAGVALARKLDDRVVFHAALAAAELAGPAVLREALAANAGKFPIGFGLASLVLRYPEEDWARFVTDPPSTDLGMAIQDWSEVSQLLPEARQRVLDRIDDLPLAVRHKLSAALLTEWVHDDPPAAMQWALARAKPEDPAAVESQRVVAAFHAWLRTDRDGLRAWCAQLPASPLGDSLRNQLAAAFAKDGNRDQTLALFKPGPGAELAAASIAAAEADRDPAAAAAWLDTLPAEVDVAKSVAPVIQKWFATDPEGAARWVEAQPAGARRDAALLAYANAVLDRDPAAAGAWAAAIGNPKARMQAAELVFIEMTQSDPAAARAWLRDLAGIDDKWRDRMLRRR